MGIFLFLMGTNSTFAISQTWPGQQGNKVTLTTSPAVLDQNTTGQVTFTYKTTDDSFKDGDKDHLWIFEIVPVKNGTSDFNLIDNWSSSNSKLFICNEWGWEKIVTQHDWWKGNLAGVIFTKVTSDGNDQDNRGCAMKRDGPNKTITVTIKDIHDYTYIADSHIKKYTPINSLGLETGDFAAGLYLTNTVFKRVSPIYSVAYHLSNSDDSLDIAGDGKFYLADTLYPFYILNPKIGETYYYWIENQHFQDNNIPFTPYNIYNYSDIANKTVDTKDLVSIFECPGQGGVYVDSGSSCPQTQNNVGAPAPVSVLKIYLTTGNDANSQRACISKRIGKAGQGELDPYKLLPKSCDHYYSFQTFLRKNDMPQDPILNQIIFNQQKDQSIPDVIPPPPSPCAKLIGGEKCIEINTGLHIPLLTTSVGFVGNLLGILLSISGGVALFLIIQSGYTIMMSQGNPEKVQGAKETITSAIIGLLFIIFSLVILQIIGVDILKIPGLSR